LTLRHVNPNSADIYLGLMMLESKGLDWDTCFVSGNTDSAEFQEEQYDSTYNADGFFYDFHTASRVIF